MRKLVFLLLAAVIFNGFALFAQIEVKSDNKVVVGTDFTPHKDFNVYGSSYFKCKPASSGIYFENYNYSPTRPIIKPQWANSAYLGHPDFQFYRVYVHEVMIDGQCYISSDERMKQHIKPITGSLNKIKLLRPVKYDLRPDIYKNTPEETKQKLIEKNKNKIGFIALELKNVYPELVTFNEESGKYAVNYIGLVQVLVEALQEQQKMLEKQQKEIELLKKQMYNGNNKTDKE